MPALSARTQANRLNAQKSTGPSTPQGKAASSRNATRHGLFCKHLLLEGESAQELAEMKDGLLRRLNPRDHMELRVCDQIIACHWKLLRIRAAEKDAFADQARLLKEQHKQTGDAGANCVDQPLPEPSAGSLLFRMLDKAANSTIERLSKYEARICNQLQKHMKELRTLQEEPVRGLISEFVGEVLKEQTATLTAVQNEANEQGTEAKYPAQQQMDQPPREDRRDADVEMLPLDIDRRIDELTAGYNSSFEAPKSAA